MRVRGGRGVGWLLRGRGGGGWLLGRGRGCERLRVLHCYCGGVGENVAVWKGMVLEDVVVIPIVWRLWGRRCRKAAADSLLVSVESVLRYRYSILLY